MKTNTSFKKGHAPTYTAKRERHVQYKHGQSGHKGRKATPLYKRWEGMKRRCLNPNDSHFKHYGGRGIKITSRWLDFQNFADDAGPTFSPELSLDRIDVNGDYCPENCRWVPLIEQQRNKRSNNTKHVLLGVLAAIEAGADPKTHITDVLKCL